MPEDQPLSEQQAHRKFAVDLFNFTWSLLNKLDRSLAEADQMLHAAHASRYHWGVVGTPVNLARGEWQVSRVYTVLNRPEPALYHARRCLEICQQEGIGDFDLAFAYEALARAYTVAGEPGQAAHFRELGAAAGEEIGEQNDRELFFKDLGTVPG